MRRVGAGIACLVAGLVSLAGWWFPTPLASPFQRLETLWYDASFAFRGGTPRPESPLVVGIDGQTEQTLGKSWPFPRSYLAKAVRSLTKDGARVIAIDLILSQPSTPKEDRELHSALANAPKVVIASRFDRSGTGEASQKSLIGGYYSDAQKIDFEQNAVLGLAETPKEADGIVRRWLPAQTFQGQAIPSLAYAAAILAAGEDLEGVNLVAGRWEPLSVSCDGPAGQDPIDGSPLPSQWIGWPGGWSALPPQVKFEAVVNGEFPPGTFKGRTVFLGITGGEIMEELGEGFVISPTHLKPDQAGGRISRLVPGVVVQALASEAIAKGSRITPVPAVIGFLIAGALTALSLLASHRLMGWQGLALLLGSAVAALALSLALFSAAGVFWPPATPTLLASLAGVSSAWADRAKLRRTWGTYVSPSVLRLILRSGEEPPAQRMEAVIMFGDVRGFTAFSEKHTPEKVNHLLNSHFEKLTKIIYEEEGTIDKFIGDGIMAIWGAPFAVKDAEIKAVRAAWRMLEAAEAPVKDHYGEEFTLPSGFALAYGPFVSGLVGSRQRHDFSAIGHVVNLAARLEGITGKPDVVLDSALYERVKEKVEAEQIGPFKLKNIDKEVFAWRVTGLK